MGSAFFSFRMVTCEVQARVFVGASGSQSQLRPLPLRLGLVGLPRMRAQGGNLAVTQRLRWRVLLLDVRQQSGCPVYVNSSRPGDIHFLPSAVRK